MSAIDRARKDELNRRLLVLASWSATRAHGEFDTETTLTMLKKKVIDLEDGMKRAGWSAAKP